MIAAAAEDTPSTPLTPRIAALRFGEEIRPATTGAGEPLGEPELLATPISGPGTGRASPRSAGSLALLAALGLGALLVAFSAVPDSILVRSPRGLTVVRARIEIGLAGAAIVVLVGLIFLAAGN